MDEHGQTRIKRMKTDPRKLETAQPQYKGMGRIWQYPLLAYVRHGEILGIRENKKSAAGRHASERH